MGSDNQEEIVSFYQYFVPDGTAMSNQTQAAGMISCLFLAPSYLT